MDVEAVVFDIGNVLVEWHPLAFYDREIGKARRRHLFDAVDLEGMNTAVDLGRPLDEAVADLVARHPDWAREIGWWESRWIEMFAPVIDGSVALMSAVRAKGLPVYALTNFGRETLAWASRVHPFLTTFDRRFVSAELQLMKPDPRIYAAVEAETGIAPAGLLFADDRAENVTAAAERGWRAHLFDGPQGWAARLVAEGVLTHGEASACL